MRYLNFVLTASDLEGCYHNLEAFHHEQDMVQWTEKLRPCAEALYMNGVVSLLQETMNSCPTSVREITPAFLLKDAAYGAIAYVYHELPNYRSFENWFLEPSHEHPNLHIIHRKVAVIFGQWVSEIKDDTERPVYCALIRLLQGKDLSVRLAACQSLCLHIEDANFSEMEFVDLLPICWNSCFILFEEVQKNPIPKSCNFSGNVVILDNNPNSGTTLDLFGCFSFQQYSAPCVVLLCQGHVNDLAKTANILVDKICQVLLGAAKDPETWSVCFKPWDSGESSHISWSLYFQQWDPGGRLYAGCFLYPHLEDKVCLQEGSIDRDLDPRPNRTRPEITKTHGSMSHLILTCLTNCCVGRKEGE